MRDALPFFVGAGIGWVCAVLAIWVDRYKALAWASGAPKTTRISGIEITLDHQPGACPVCALRRVLIRGGALASSPAHDCPDDVPEVLQ